jgi:hypothetical protein
MMTNESDVLQAERFFFTALIGAKIDELKSLLADDFTLADLGGGLMSKAVLLQAVDSGQLHFDSIEPAEASVRFYGATAIVTGRTEMRGRFGGTAIVAQSRYTHVYFEREGKLSLVAAQGTPIASG